MLRSIQPLQLLATRKPLSPSPLTLLAGWLNGQRLDAIQYLKEQNRPLKERLGGR